MKLSPVLLVVLSIIFAFSIQAQPVTDGSDGSSEKTASAKKKAFRPTKSQITEAQQRLKSDDRYEGPVDGRYNDDFRASLSVYQKSSGLEENGKLDEATVLRLGIELSDKQKGIETPSKPKRVVFRVSKEQISEAQSILKSSGAFNGEIDGKYSKGLRAVIRDYQSANGLKRKGSLNRATLEKMGVELSDAQKAIPVNPNDIATEGSSGRKRGPVFRATKEQIVTVQSMLRSKGLYSGEDTGKLNPETRTAIKEWQGANGVKVTGTLNKATLEAMNVELTDKQKGS